MLRSVIATLALAVLAVPGTARASYCDYYSVEVVPGMTLEYHPKGGRAYFYSDPPYAADAFRWSYTSGWRGGIDRLPLGISWPEASTPALSLSARAKNWDVFIVSPDRPADGTVLRFIADGSEVYRTPPDYFSPRMPRDPQGVYRVIVPGGPDLRRYRRMTVERVGPDGGVVDRHGFDLPNWKKLDRAMTRAAARLVKAKDAFNPPECGTWPVI